MFKWFARRVRGPGGAEQQYEAIVTAARHPAHYMQLAVADDIAGRFEMLTLHLFLVLERLRVLGPSGETATRDLLETFFSNLDHEHREMGLADLSVARKMGRTAEAVYGRLKAYAEGVREPSGEALRAALGRNLYGGREEPVAAGDMATYVVAALRHLATVETADVLAGRLTFPEPGEVVAGRPAAAGD
ncbi:MAG: ubiquinol-cytochrome C chaperone [Rhizobiales bacterium]|nr:ubiquinol-cytochrome C chaperone [Hyphomicrobiales bacterium]